MSIWVQSHSTYLIHSTVTLGVDHCLVIDICLMEIAWKPVRMYIQTVWCIYEQTSADLNMP